MFKIQVSKEIMHHCIVQNEKYNFGHRSQGNGNKEQQLTGIIGQSVVMSMFGLGYVDGSEGFDGGTDIVYDGKTIDVKTMGRTTDVRLGYTNNFIKAQDLFIPNIYIFCSFNKLFGELTICGWIDRKTFRQRRKCYLKGSIRYRNDGSSFVTKCDNYEIGMMDIYDVSSIDQLKFQIQSHKSHAHDNSTFNHRIS